MRFILAILVAFLISYNALGQIKSDSISVKENNVKALVSLSKTDSLLIDIKDQLNSMEFRMRGLDIYKIYPTDNTYILLKLDTATGQLWLVQWSLKSNEEMQVPIISSPLSYRETGCGTYELYPTQNIYQFVLLNKVEGSVWHVQWGTSSEKRWYRRIY